MSAQLYDFLRVGPSEKINFTLRIIFFQYARHGQSQHYIANAIGAA